MWESRAGGDGGSVPAELYGTSYTILSIHLMWESRAGGDGGSVPAELIEYGARRRPILSIHLMWESRAGERLYYDFMTRFLRPGDLERLKDSAHCRRFFRGHAKRDSAR